MPIGRLPTEFDCPKCKTPLQRTAFYNGFFGCLLLNPILQAVCGLHCHLCGRVDGKTLSDEQRTVYEQRKTYSTISSCVLGVVLVVILRALAVSGK